MILALALFAGSSCAATFAQKLDLNKMQATLTNRQLEAKYHDWRSCFNTLSVGDGPAEYMRLATLEAEYTKILVVRMTRLQEFIEEKQLNDEYLDHGPAKKKAGGR